MVCSLNIVVHRTQDMALVKKLATHPAIYPHIIDDGCPKNPANWHPIDSSNRYYLIPWLISLSNDPVPMGIIAFYPLNHVLFEAHIFLLPEFQGKATDSICLKTISWMFANSPCQKIMAFIPTTKIYLVNLVESLNFEREGYIKKSISYQGELVDQYIYSLGRLTNGHG
jgi:RimJ/RimL family protein N-acetyltransferase